MQLVGSAHRPSEEDWLAPFFRPNDSKYPIMAAAAMLSQPLKF
jgi:hypothetical protein